MQKQKQSKTRNLEESIPGMISKRPKGMSLETLQDVEKKLYDFNLVISRFYPKTIGKNWYENFDTELRRAMEMRLKNGDIAACYHCEGKMDLPSSFEILPTDNPHFAVPQKVADVILKHFYGGWLESLTGFEYGSEEQINEWDKHIPLFVKYASSRGAKYLKNIDLLFQRIMQKEKGLVTCPNSPIEHAKMTIKVEPSKPLSKSRNQLAFSLELKAKGKIEDTLDRN